MFSVLPERLNGFSGPPIVDQNGESHPHRRFSPLPQKVTPPVDREFSALSALSADSRSHPAPSDEGLSEYFLCSPRATDWFCRTPKMWIKKGGCHPSPIDREFPALPVLSALPWPSFRSLVVPCPLLRLSRYQSTGAISKYVRHFLSVHHSPAFCNGRVVLVVSRSYF